MSVFDEYIDEAVFQIKLETLKTLEDKLAFCREFLNKHEKKTYHTNKIPTEKIVDVYAQMAIDEYDIHLNKGYDPHKELNAKLMYELNIIGAVEYIQQKNDMHANTKLIAKLKVIIP